MSPLTSFIVKANGWEIPPTGIEAIVEKRFDILPSDFFENTIIPFVDDESRDHLFYKLFLEMMKNSGNDYEYLEDYLYEKQEELDYFECQNEEIPHIWQKIIYKFICDEYHDEYPID